MIYLIHDISQLSFVRRVIHGLDANVSKAAHDLQRVGYIIYVRGRVTILDRKGLKNDSCECYRIVKREYDRDRPRPPRSTNG
jgi:hypothetical protein